MSGGEGGGGGRRPGLQLWNLKGPEWKTAAWMGGLLALGLVLLLSRPAAAPGRLAAADPAPQAAASAAAADPLAAEAAALSQTLAAALERIAGAGTVTAQVRLAAGPQTEYATNDQDSEAVTSDTGSASGGQATTQQTTSTQVVMSSSGAPVVASVQAATVAGVLIVATGASDPVIQAELASAAQAVTGAPLYLITVLPAGGGAGDGSGSPAAS